jgi:hypothetical protein
MKSEKTKRQAQIRMQQQLELLFIFYWLLWVSFWLINYLKTRDAIESFYIVPFEREIRVNDSAKTYLQSRKRYAWKKYVNKELDYKERVKKASRKRDQSLDK